MNNRKLVTAEVLRRAHERLAQYKHPLKPSDLWTEVIDQVTAEIGNELWKELIETNNRKLEVINE